MILRREVTRIGEDAGAEAVAVAFYDYATETGWSCSGGRWFHAASTIKLAILLALFDQIDEGRYTLRDRLHVRNRFHSAADGSLFRVGAERDANAEVHSKRGLSMPLKDLAHHMITTSSNLATNLLLDLVAVDAAQQSLKKRGIKGIDLRRGVEDEAAFEAGINNRVTADGLVALLRAIYEREELSEDAAKQILDILFQQQFRKGIPAGLPDPVREGAQVANKTGEISTVAHDAGLVFLPDREPYALAVLTEWAPDKTGDRRATIAKISEMVFNHLTHFDREKEAT